jgi:hypothetical protein
MSKMYLGQIPSLADGWEKIGECLDDDRVKWLVFKKPQEHSDEWITYKVVADGRAINKANYWLARNDATGQIGFARDYAFMSEKRPKLREEVDQIIEKNSYVEI